MAKRTRRIELRVDPETGDVIAAPAAAGQETMSGFIVRVVRAEGDRILARSDVTAMPAAEFDDLFAALDDPDPARTLTRVVVRPRQFTHE